MAKKGLYFNLSFVEGCTNSYVGTLITGKPPSSSGNQFRSQAELVKAMADTRYETDPAYRQDVMEKLTRSQDVNF